MVLTTIYIFFFFNDTATTEIYTLSLHDALPISQLLVEDYRFGTCVGAEGAAGVLHVAQVLLGGPAGDGLRALVREAPPPGVAAPPLPALLPGGVEGGRHHVAGGADQEDHAALG